MQDALGGWEVTERENRRVNICEGRMDGVGKRLQ